MRLGSSPLKLPDYRCSMQFSCIHSRERIQENCRPALEKRGGGVFRHAWCPSPRGV